MGPSPGTPGRSVPQDPMDPPGTPRTSEPSDPLESQNLRTLGKLPLPFEIQNLNTVQLFLIFCKKYHDEVSHRYGSNVFFSKGVVLKTAIL